MNTTHDYTMFATMYGCHSLWNKKSGSTRYYHGCKQWLINSGWSLVGTPVDIKLGYVRPWCRKASWESSISWDWAENTIYVVMVVAFMMQDMIEKMLRVLETEDRDRLLIYHVSNVIIHVYDGYENIYNAQHSRNVT